MKISLNKIIKIIFTYYLLPILLGSIFFILIFAFQIYFLLEITPPKKLFTIPLLLGIIIGSTIGYLRRRCLLLSLEVRNYQLSLKNMIATKTKELEMKNQELKTLSFTDSLRKNRKNTKTFIFDYV